MATNDKAAAIVREYRMVVLSLNNVLLPPERWSPTPSEQDGLDPESEMALRMYGSELIQIGGYLLKLPQTAMATGQLLYQRFFHSKSFVKHTMEVFAMACVNLSSKIEEAPRRIRDVLNVFHHIKQVRSGKTISPMVLDTNYLNMKNLVIKAERRILKELGFCVHVKHPHKIIVMYLQVLESYHNKALIQKAWNYMNDSFRTDLFVKYHPETIAVACIYIAARELKVVLPTQPPWYEVFGCASLELLQHIALQILAIYKRAKPNVEKFEAECERLRLISLEKKALKEDATPTTSRAVSPSHADSPLTKEKNHNDNTNTSDGSFGRDRSRSPRKRSRSRTPRSITNNRSYTRSRSRSRSPKRSRGRHHHGSRQSRRDRDRSYSPKKSKSRGNGRDDYRTVSSKNDYKYKNKYSSRDKYYDDDYSSKKSRKRKSASYSPGSPRKSPSESPERSRNSKKKERRSHRSKSRNRSGRR